jgi:hypothetical protein
MDHIQRDAVIVMLHGGLDGKGIYAERPAMALGPHRECEQDE